MKYYIIFSYFIFANVSLAQVSPEVLLKESDKSRGGIEDGLSWVSELKTRENGQTTVRKFLVKSKGTDAIVEATEPLRTKGEIYVFNDRNMWLVKPDLKKPVSISPKAKLTGLASNGDIASTWYSRDYTAVLEKKENIKNESHYVLLLKAKTNTTTYDQIRYWINEKTQLATKADFLSLQGDVLKTAIFRYENKIKLGGKSIPFVSEMYIEDKSREDYKSILKYIDLKSSQYKTGEFNINNIRN